MLCMICIYASRSWSIFYARLFFKESSLPLSLSQLKGVTDCHIRSVTGKNKDV